MSAIGGIQHLDSSRVDSKLLTALANGLATRGPDGGREIVFDSVGMAYRAFHTNKESRRERQPLIKDNKMLVWDGRLDNRSELMLALGQELKDDLTDVAIVMAAYLKWPRDFLRRLIGDFALAMWDSQQRQLILARDLIGPRTLYYYVDAQRVVWSTELCVLIDVTGITREVNDEYIADYLTRLPDPGQTPYKRIHAVPPAHAVVVKDGRVRTQRFWEFNPGYAIRYKTDAEYEEHFRELFRGAVRSRLRSDRTVWAELSGGLDSSSVVCMADDVIKSGGAEAPELKTVSNVFDEAASCDERHYIQLVEERIGRRGCHLREDDFRAFAPLRKDFQISVPNPIANFAAYYVRVNEVLVENRARVLLSGKGGDEILCSARDPTPELADLLVDWDVLRLHNRVKIWSRVLRRSYLDVLFKNAVMPLLPEMIQGRWKRRMHPEFFELYDQKFAKRMNFAMRRLGPPAVFGHRRPSGRDQAKWFLQAVRHLSAGYWKEFGNAEISYPFTHRPLVEFMHAVPFDQRVRLTETRSLLRRSLRNLLPEEIANRKGKRLNTEAAVRGLAREWPRLNEMFLDPLVCAHGYVDADVLRSKLALAKDGKDPSALAMAFVIPLEYWLRTQLERT
jgi:asparagine synthase (glutamine-hydrolysing)